MADFYCPECHNKLQYLSGCGAVGYLCGTCKKLISRSRILSYDDMIRIKESNPVKDDEK